jgi:M6 family metalloprotease-like protein
MKKISAIIIFLAATFIVGAVSYAVPSRDGKHRGPKEAIKSREVTMVYDEKTKTMKAIRKSGTIHVAVIPVQFVSAGQQTSESSRWDPFNGRPTTNPYYNNPQYCVITSTNIVSMSTNLTYLKNFYNEVSYGTVNVQFTVFFSSGLQETVSQLTGAETCVQLSTPMAYYGATSNSVEGTNGGQGELIQDAGAAANVNASSGFDTVIVLHAGYGNESTAGDSGYSNPGDIWSVQVDLSYYGTPNGFSYGIVVPAMEDPDPDTVPRGVMCHEFGHYLGLPDLYNTASENSVVGLWCLMDDGAWQNNGYNPTHPCVWCKQYLGLVTPQVISSSEQVSGVSPVETSSSGVYQLNVSNNPGEYFLVCFTTTSPYDQEDPGTGVLIYHIDEGSISGCYPNGSGTSPDGPETFTQRMTYNDINTSTVAFTVALITAQSSNIIGMPTDNPYEGGPGDTWPQPGILTFAAPLSNSVNGNTTGISISNFVLSSSAAGFYAAASSVSTSQPGGTTTTVAGGAGVAAARVYPNPFIPFMHHTGLTFDNLAAGARIKIFNKAGELVREVSDSGGTGKINWDGTNDNGSMVASGVYIAYIQGSAGTTSLKFAIIK